MPGLSKGAVVHFDKTNGQYYAKKDGYIDYYYFTKSEVESNKKWFRLRRFFTFLLILFYQVSFSQADTLIWETDNEVSVSQYEIQYGQDSTNWTTVTQIPKGQNYYTYVLPVTTGYYRLKGGPFASSAAFLSFNSVSITYPVAHTTSLTWVVSNEQNVLYYWIRKTRNGSTTQVTPYAAKGNGNYKYWMKKTVYQYQYTITPIYKDLTPGTIINFN